MNRPADRAGLSFYQTLRQKARLMSKKPGTEFRKGILHTGKLNQIRLGNRLKTGAVTKSLAVGLDGGRDPSGQRLQESWGVIGEEALLGKMLTAGEFAALFSAAQRVCGFLSAEEAGKVKAELKKDSPAETGS